MTGFNQLRQLAIEFATEAKNRASRLQKEILDLQTPTAEKQAALDAANLASERAANFSVQVGGDYQCLRCCIERGIQSSMVAIGGGGAREDRFRRRNCDFTVTIPH